MSLISFFDASSTTVEKESQMQKFVPVRIFSKHSYTILQTRQGCNGNHILGALEKAAFSYNRDRVG